MWNNYMEIVYELKHKVLNHLYLGNHYNNHNNNARNKACHCW